MSMEQIRDHYGVPAKRGARVTYTHRGRRHGTIVASVGHHLRIRLDGDTHTGSYHPLWELDYGDGIDHAAAYDAHIERCWPSPAGSVQEDQEG